jgi:hypothetical protein
MRYYSSMVTCGSGRGRLGGSPFPVLRGSNLDLGTLENVQQTRGCVNYLCQ